MFNKIRHKIAYCLAQKSLALVETKNFANIMKGLNYLQWSLIILPDCETKANTIKELKRMANEETAQSQDEGLV